MTESKIALHDEVTEYLPKDQAEDHRRTVDLITRQATELAVYDAVTERQAAELLGRAKQRQGQFDALRTAIVGPFNTHIRRINAFFGGCSDEYTPAVVILNKKLGGYRADQDAKAARERADAQRKLQDQNRTITGKAKEKDIDPESVLKKTAAVPEVPKSVTAQTSRLTYRDVIRHEISANAKANPCKAVPKEYITLDESKVAAAVRGKIIPVGDHGWVRVWLEKQPVSQKL